jgi:hypothetical protein
MMNQKQRIFKSQRILYLFLLKYVFNTVVFILPKTIELFTLGVSIVLNHFALIYGVKYLQCIDK